ncbi:MAG TPA: UPF0175 family protein [Candidatus Acidoferrales bacterium]|nr:UPF0175 family protein [Candidatus Acidoferrales bacterium]
MNLEIPDDIVRATHLSPEELRLEIAVMLFERERLTLGQASMLAGKKQPDFQQILASRKIPLHYDVEDFRKDLQTLRDLGVR